MIHFVISLNGSAHASAFLFLVVALTARQSPAQDVARLDRRTTAELHSIASSLASAMKSEDEGEIRRQVQKSIEILGDQAGLPEAPDRYRAVPASAHALSPDELPKAFSPYVAHIERMKWWRIGLDPTQTNHALREVAAVIEGCLEARNVQKTDSVVLLSVAKEAGDFLMWAQAQGQAGVFPFPAIRNGKGRPFEVAERFYKRAEKDGKINEVIRNGWAVEDFGDGGLQFDNGLAGVALIHLYEATDDRRYKDAALASANWARDRVMVPNWNYNSFSVFLLAEAYRISNDPGYLASAKTKALLGVIPGQLIAGPRRGRWADPHNARPPYHYIMIRSLAALASVMPSDDSELPRIIESLRLALAARNPDFRKGVFDADSAPEALVLTARLPQHIATKLTECKTNEALSILQRYSAEAFRSRKGALGPRAWGYLLAHRDAMIVPKN